MAATRGPRLKLNSAAVNHLLGDNTQSGLAESAGISGGALSEMMTGIRRSSLAEAERIAAALGVDPGVIFPELAGFEVAVFTARGADL